MRNPVYRSVVDVMWGDETWDEMQHTGRLWTGVTPPKAVTDTEGGR